MNLRLARLNMHAWLRTWVLAVTFTWLAASVAEAATEGPAVGSAAPEFKLQDQTGKWHELKDYRGKWVALYFYPKDKTPAAPPRPASSATTCLHSATPVPSSSA